MSSSCDKMLTPLKETSNNSESTYSASSSEKNLMLLSVSNLASSNNCSLVKNDFDPKLNQSCQSYTSNSSNCSEETPHGETMSSIEVNNDSVISRESTSSRSYQCDVESLQDALASLQTKLTAKDMEIAALSRVREELDSEMEDLTASLFEEAHKMVREANVKQASAEKSLVEANMKIDGLETEVAALKTLVLTSTPSQPNKHLHPQIDPKLTKENAKKLKKGASPKDSKNSSSDSMSKSIVSRNLSNGLENGSLNQSHHHSSLVSKATNSKNDIEDDESHPSRNFDPVLRKDYLSWKKSPTLDESQPFISRIYKEDINLCLLFPNQELSRRVNEAVHNNTLCLSPIKDFSQIPRNCALLDSPVLCKYQLKLQEDTYFISQLARNRLATVCDCLTYLRYVHQGLVKASANDVYWEIMRLRRQMAIARLGFQQD